MSAEARGTRPRYRDLPEIEPGYRHAWDVIVDGDPRVLGGRIASPERIVAAARLVRRGVVFDLDVPIDRGPGAYLGRSPGQHQERATAYGRDDLLTEFHLQSGTQWDGLRHVRFRKHGYYGGLADADLDAGDQLGIGHLARHGIVARAVLADVAAQCSAAGRSSSPSDRTVISVADLRAALQAQASNIEPGDVLLVRTGWLAWSRTLDGQRTLHGQRVETAACIGLDAREEMAEWLWDSGAIAVAADTPALEAMPIRSREEGFLHHRLIPLLGIVIGELWDLERLAEDCRSDGRYDGFLVSHPLAIPRGAGSPANAYVLK